MSCNKQSFWVNGVSARKQRCGHLGKWFFSWNWVDFSSTSSVWAMWVCQKWSRRCVLLLFFYKIGIEPVTKTHVYWYDINLIFPTRTYRLLRNTERSIKGGWRHGSGGCFCTRPFSTCSHVHSCISGACLNCLSGDSCCFLPSWYFQFCKCTRSSPCILSECNCKATHHHYSSLSFRVWSLRKMLIIIFSLITEKSSKSFF